MVSSGRESPSWLCGAFLWALTPAIPAFAADPAALAPGTWVRLTTGSEVTGDGFAM